MWFELAVLADSYLLDDPFVTAQIVRFGGYSQLEQEQAKKKYTETEYKSLDSYKRVRDDNHTGLRVFQFRTI